MLDFAAKDKQFGTTVKVWARYKRACRGIALPRTGGEDIVRPRERPHSGEGLPSQVCGFGGPMGRAALLQERPWGEVRREQAG